MVESSKAASLSLWVTRVNKKELIMKLDADHRFALQMAYTESSDVVEFIFMVAESASQQVMGIKQAAEEVTFSIFDAALRGYLEENRGENRGRVERAESMLDGFHLELTEQIKKNGKECLSEEHCIEAANQLCRDIIKKHHLKLSVSFIKAG